MYRFVEKLRGQTTALVILLMLATNPTLIAYSRFGWETSGSPLASFLVLYAAANWSLEWALLMLFVACLVHPTNVFLLPIAGAIWGLRSASPRFGGMSMTIWRWSERHRRSSIAIVCALALAGFALMWAQGWYHKVHVDRIGSRFDVMGVIIFTLDFIDLICGISVYLFIAGPISPAHRLLAEAVFACTTMGVAVFGTWRLFQRRDRFGMGLAMETVMALIALYLIGGPDAIPPNYERYGVGLVVPALLLLAICLCASFTPGGSSIGAVRSAGPLMAVSALA